MRQRLLKEDIARLTRVVAWALIGLEFQIPNRTPRWVDPYFNALGLVIVLVALAWFMWPPPFWPWTRKKSDSLPKG